ncbi:hypothetical protein OZ411_32285 [Bradyrhizobium sp. Arg237L]|uniref:hypothetical protein n=1 Tax=Bradyrhizobium sp. Arg237L TaxID=3003352 RepID=UPI00249EA188|nr:hypothetical protein [Bradyrhizobium sp. Arg237L]MDI4237496.1 hypothetical protein [Bradyrhizobium sp. Arg237L]
MKNIADLLMRFWQGSQPASNTQVAAMAGNRDRSSMADFVRILQAYDQDQYGRSWGRPRPNRLLGSLGEREEMGDRATPV